jgi:hypothetical protein
MMTEAVATLDAVRDAMGKIRHLGEKPTFSKVRELTGGGSKSTILSHMNAVFSETALKQADSDLPHSFLASAAAPMLRQLWEKAERAANHEYSSRIQYLFDIQSAMSEELAAALARAEKAELELADARSALRVSEEAGFHLDTLSELIRALRDIPDEPARIQLLRILVGADLGVPKDEVYRRMKSAGYQDMTIYQARYHAKAAGLIHDLGDEVYCLTPKGIDLMDAAA